MALVVIAALLVGAAAGLVAGLLGAAAYIAVHAAGHEWSGWHVLADVTTVAAFVTYGGIGGLIAGYLRNRRVNDQREPAATGAGGSLGLLTLNEGRDYLGLECERSRLNSQPVAVVTVQATLQPGTPEMIGKHAVRAAARAFESSVVAGMQPVLLAHDTFGMVVVGFADNQCRDFMQLLVTRINDATFADRATGSRPKASEVLRLEARLAFHAPESRLAEAEALPASVEAPAFSPGRSRAAASAAAA
jgi:hypothetical protein